MSREKTLLTYTKQEHINILHQMMRLRDASNNLENLFSQLNAGCQTIPKEYEDNHAKINQEIERLADYLFDQYNKKDDQSS